MATPGGVRLATLKLETGFTVISPRTGPGRLVVLHDNQLFGYGLR